MSFPLPKTITMERNDTMQSRMTAASRKPPNYRRSTPNYTSSVSHQDYPNEMDNYPTNTVRYGYGYPAPPLAPPVIRQPNEKEDPQSLNDYFNKDGPTSWSAAWHIFMSEVSIGGIRFVFADSSGMIRRLIWSVLVLIGVGLMIYQIVAQLILYYSFPTAVKVKVNYQKSTNGTIQFPKVTLCSMNMMWKDILYEYDPTGVAPYVAQNLFPPIIEMEGLVVPPTIDELMAAPKANDLRGMIDYAGPRLSEELIACTWSATHQCNYTWFKPMYTEHGLCYTFNTDGKLRSKDRGSVYGLRMVIASTQPRYAVNPSMTAGYEVAFTRPGEVPIMEGLSYPASNGVGTKFELRTTKIVNLPVPHGNCSSRTLKNFKNYTMDNCQRDCLIEKVKENCSCVPYFYETLSEGEEFCDVIKTMTCAWVEMYRIINMDNRQEYCNCPVPCETFKYQATVTTARYSDHTYDLLDKAFGYTREEVSRDAAVIEIYFGETSTMEIESVASYTGFSLLCDIGGAMGLVLGSTFLTAIEFIDFFVMQTMMSIQNNVNGEHTVKVMPQNGMY